MKPKNTPYFFFKKSICALLIFAIASINVVNQASVAYAMEKLDYSSSSNLVLVLAEEGLMNDSGNYVGLNQSYSRYLNTSSLAQRVKRYADDVRKKFSNTEVKILNIPKNQDPVLLAAYLKDVYYRNYAEFEDNQLKGIVLIGDIPLPKLFNSSEFALSLYPYTDFDNPAFIFNPETRHFEVDPGNLSYEPEIYHGLINFTESANSYADIATFLDKNHLNALGIDDFVNPPEAGILIADSFNESKLFLQDIQDLYDLFQSANKYIAQNKVTKEVVKTLYARFPIPEIENLIENIDNVPDTMVPSILNSIKVTASDLFKNAVRKNAEKAQSTGRYDAGNIYSPFLAVQYLDGYAATYLNRLNQFIQAQFIDVYSRIAQPVNILKGSTLTVDIFDRDGNSQEIGEINFVNHGINPSFFDFLDFDILQDETEIIRAHEPEIFGLDFNRVNSSRDCRIFRGGGLQEEVAKTMYNNRAALIGVNQDDNGPTCYNPPRQTDDYKLTRASYQRDTNSDNCTIFKGNDLQDEYRGYPVELDYESKLDVRSCFAMNTVDEFIEKKGIASFFGIPVNGANTRTLNRYENSDDDRLQAGYNLTDVFSIFKSNYDSQDWHDFSSYFLANPVKDVFVKDNPFGLNSPIASLRLNVRKFRTNKNISSLTIHNDPDGDIVEKALVSGNMNLPIDHRNYVTYYDNQGEFRKDILPDAFYVNSSQSYLNEIDQLVATLATRNLSPDDSVKLSNLLADEFTDELNSELSIQEIQKVSIPKLQFLIDYLSLDLNSKYRLMVKNLLDANFPLNIDGFNKDFDFVEINTFANDQEVLFDLTSPDFAKLQIVKPLTTEFSEDEFQDFDQENSGIGLFEYFTEYLPDWFLEQSDRVASVFDLDSYSLNWNEEDVESDFKYSANQPTQISVSNLPLFIDQDTQEVEIKIEARTENFDISKDYEEILTIQDSNKWNILNPDLDQELEGTQVRFEDGIVNLRVNPLIDGEINLSLSTQYTFLPYNLEDLTVNTDIFRETKIINGNLRTKIVNGMQIKADEFFAFNQIAADQVTPQTFSFKIVDSQNSIVDFGEPKITSNNSNFGIRKLDSSNGVYNFAMRIPVRTDEYTVKVEFNGLEPIEHTIKVVPGPLTKLRVNTGQTLLSGLSANQILVNVLALDQFNNLVTNSNQELSLNYTQDKVTLEPNNNLRLVNGNAVLKFKTLPLKDGFFEISVAVNDIQEKLKYHLALGLTLQDLQGMNSNSLSYLLNTNQSEVYNKKAEKLLLSGKTQSLITNTNSHVNQNRLLTVHPDRSIEFLENDKLDSSLQILNDQINLSFYYEDQIFLKIPFNQTRNSKIVSENTSDNTNPFIKLIPNIQNSEVSFDSSSITFQNQELIQISPQLIIDDSIEVKSSLGNTLSFDLFKDQTLIATLILNTKAERFLQSPISYQHPILTKGSENSHDIYNYLNSVSFYTPGQSNTQFLDSSKNTLAKGLDNPSRFANSNDKTLLLFTSGQALGPSLKSYSELTTVLLGDPTLTLVNHEVLAEKFNYTLGEKIDSMDTTISSILNTDDFIIMGDSNGYLSLYNKESQILQKSHIKLPLNPKQMLVLNQDPLEILILFEDNCHLDDTCTYILKQSEDQTLELLRYDLPDQVNPQRIYAEDLNGDQKNDLIVYDKDFNLSIYERLNQFQLSKKFEAFIFPYPAQYFLDQNYIYLEDSSSEYNFSSLEAHAGYGFYNFDLTASQNPQDSEFLDVKISTNITKLSSNQSTSSKIAVSAPLNLQDLYLEYDNQIYPMSNQSTEIYNYITDQRVPLLNLNQVVIGGKVKKSEMQDFPFISTTQDEFISNSLTQSQFEFLKSNNLNNEIDYQDLSYQQIQTQVGVDNKPDLKIPFIAGSKILHLQSSEYGYFPVFQTIPVPRVNLNSDEALMDVVGLEGLSEDELNAIAEAARINQFFTDANSDGYSDLYSNLSATASMYANETEEVLEDVVCGDSCLANPYNEAFLVPGSTLSPPVPLIGTGCPWGPVPIGFGTPAYPACAFRLYLSPTLTGSFVLAPCFAMQCYRFQIATLPESVCNAVNQRIEQASNYVIEQVSEYTDGAVNLDNPNARRSFNPPSFPAIFATWAKNQIFEIIKVIDLPDLKVIYPVLIDSSNISPENRGILKYALYTGEDSLDQIDSLNPYPNCPESQINNDDDYKTFKDKCGNFGSLQEYKSAKSSYLRRFLNDPKQYFEELSKMPIWDFELENLVINYPTYPDKELAEFYKSLLTSIEKSIQNFMQALLSWGCFEYEDSQRPLTNDLDQYTTRDLWDNIVKIFTSIAQETSQTWSGNRNELMWTYKDVQYRDFFGAENSYFSAIYNDLNGWEKSFSFLIDLVLGGHMSNIITFLNEPTDQPQTDKQKACVDLALGMQGLTTNVYESYQSALLWRDLPLQFIKIEDGIAKFTMQVLDWGDQLLTNFFGWQAENTKNLSTWTKMFESLIQIYNSFNLLFEVFIEFFESCDDCRTRRGSSFMDILLGILPDIGNSLPVFPFPKLPDITLDISRIKTGINVKIPIFQFQKQELPMPRANFAFNFPSAPDVEIGALFGSIEIPILPPPPDIGAMIQFPDLPQINLPLLPVIPLAPELEGGIDLQSQIGSELELIKTLLRIYCLILQGFVPVPELSLSQEIEDRTSRPLNIVLPIDRQISIQLPDLGIDYVKRYEAILESNLVLETDYLYDSMAGLNQLFQEEIAKVLLGWNKRVQAINEKLNFEYNVLKEIQFDDVEGVLEVGFNLNSAVDLLAQIGQIESNLITNNFDNQIKMQDFVPREDFTLENSVFFDGNKLNQANLLINDIYNNTNDNSVASLDPMLFSQNVNLQDILHSQAPSQIGEQSIKELSNIVSNSSKLNQIIQNQTDLALAESSQSEQATTARFPTGVQYIRPDGSFRRLYNYNSQDSKNSKLEFTDLDQDSDSDILHTINNEIFAKYSNTKLISNLQGVFEVSIPEDLTDAVSLINNREINLQTKFEEITFDINSIQGLENQVIDIYKPSFDKLIPFRRYVVLHNQTESMDFTEVDEVLIQNGRILKDDFEAIFVAHSDSNSYKINVPLGLYSLVHSTQIHNDLHTLNQPKAVSVDFCSDRTPPTISGNIPLVSNPVLFEDIDLDLSKSLDIGSRIIKMSLIYNNQPFLLNLNNPIFDLPKVINDQLSPINIQAIDMAGNKSELEISPKLQDLNIVLNKVSNIQITGKIVPNVSQGNVTLLKSNLNRIIPIQTQPVNQSKFEFNFDAEAEIQITDNKNRPSLEVNDNNLIINDPSLEFTVLNAYQDLDLLSILVSKDQTPVTKILLKADSNLSPELIQAKDQAQSSNAQVLIFDENPKDNINIQILNDPLSDLDQSVLITQNENLILAISRFGNPVLLDKAYSLELDSSNTNNPIQTENLDQHWISLRAKPKGDNLISFKIQNLSSTQSLNQLQNNQVQDNLANIKDNPKAEIQDLDLNSNSNFADVNSSTKGFAEINRLARLGIFEGVNIDGQNLFLPTNFLLRSEFAKTILKILCIKPRDESYLAPNVFSDILFSDSYDWFYPITKETYFLGIFQGYQGEINQFGLSPFKPFDTISRIEAVKVILEALENMNIVSLDNLTQGETWYTGYLEVAQDLSKILNPNQEANTNFLLTPSEALEPNQPISRQDFAILISRALDIYNCIEQRSQLGLPLEDLRLDESKSHIQESIERQTLLDQASSDPASSDPASSDPANNDNLNKSTLSKEQEDLLNPSNQTPLDDSTIGIMDPVCTTCPCPFEKKQGLSLQNQDKFFIIYGEYDPLDPKIYATSKVFKLNLK